MARTNPVNQLQLDITKYDINDIRVYTGEPAPEDNTELTNCEVGDIYFRKGCGVQKDNNWSYIIRPNGICECWRVQEISNIPFSYKWGSYVSVHDGTIGSITYPVTFSSLPRVTVGISCRGSNAVWNYTAAPGTTTKSPQMSFAGLNANTDSKDIIAYMYVIGPVV